MLNLLQVCRLAMQGLLQVCCKLKLLSGYAPKCVEDFSTLEDAYEAVEESLFRKKIIQSKENDYGTSYKIIEMNKDDFHPQGQSSINPFENMYCIRTNPAGFSRRLLTTVYKQKTFTLRIGDQIIQKLIFNISGVILI